MSSTEVLVYIALGLENIPVGRLWLHRRGNKETSSFEYDKNWLLHPENFALEPSLSLAEGVFHVSSDKGCFGAVGDSSPDRWGRVLMRRERVSDAKINGVTPSSLTEVDYLLGVSDIARQGALRFSLPGNQDRFLASKDKSLIPPLISLPKLLLATENFIDNDETIEDLKLLLAPGSSLGGARPKASVCDGEGNLFIAKFPRKDDEFNIVLWEAVALTLARNARINVAEWKLERVLNKTVLLIKRFDRIGNIRVPFLSAMSMLGAKDNEQHSYLELAYALMQYGASPQEDMEELWRRIIFSIMIANTDDHLRNHGFIYECCNGWRLSPAYDINPTPTEIRPRILTTAINFEDTDGSLDIALSVAQEFRISQDRAHEIISEVQAAVMGWRRVAMDLGLSKYDCERMSSAFMY